MQRGAWMRESWPSPAIAGAASLPSRGHSHAPCVHGIRTSMYSRLGWGTPEFESVLSGIQNIRISCSSQSTP
jgi:hypothetical protein